MKSARPLLCLLTATLILSGCLKLPPVPGDKALLTGLTVPGIPREAVLLKLGEPSASFESGRILTYRIGEDADGYFLMDRMVRWTNTKYSMVFVFDGNGLLQKYRLIQVR